MFQMREGSILPSEFSVPDSVLLENSLFSIDEEADSIEMPEEAEDDIDTTLNLSSFPMDAQDSLLHSAPVSVLDH